MKTGKHLARAIVHPAALISLLVFAGGAGVAAGVAAGTTAAIAAAVGVFLLWLMIVSVVGMQRARREFNDAYAKERGLAWTQNGAIPPSTELLRRGATRRADHAFTGKLDGELDGTIALYTYEEHGVGGGPGQPSEYHHFTVVLIEVPDAGARLPALYCQRRSGFRFLDGAEDVFRKTKRVELESEQLDRRCEIFADPSSDDNWIRQLFSPSFVNYLADQTPDGFAFEVENGVMCVNVNRHRGKASELDELSAAGVAVAKRISEELAE